MSSSVYNKKSDYKYSKITKVLVIDSFETMIANII